MKSVRGSYSGLSSISGLSTKRYRSPGDSTNWPTSRVHGASEKLAMLRLSLVSIEFNGTDRKIPLSWYGSSGGTRRCYVVDIGVCKPGTDLDARAKTPFQLESNAVVFGEKPAHSESRRHAGVSKAIVQCTKGR